MKTIIYLSLLLSGLSAGAQVKKVSIQASGLTCSMCSRAIYKALESVDFVDKVDANIKTSTFDVTFKPGSDVDFDRLKNKVQDAGFFVAGFWATMHFDNVKIANDSTVEAAGKHLAFVHVTEQQLNGDKTVKFLDKGFLSLKDYKKNPVSIANEAAKVGVADAGESITSSKVYHVTI